MSVTVVKSKTKTTGSQVEDLESEIAVKVTEYGKLSDERAPLDKQIKAIDKKMKPLRSELQTHVDEHVGDDEELALKSQDYIAAFGTKGNATSVTDAHSVFQMLEAIEAGLAWQIMSYGITELRKYLTPAQFDKVTNTERSKARGIKVTNIGD